jgi:hypothetical protein
VTPRVRRNVWIFEAGDQTLAWYGRAVSALIERPVENPTSSPQYMVSSGYQDTIIGDGLLGSVPAPKLVFPALAPRIS